MSNSTQWQPEMKNTHKILCPQLSPIHFSLIEQVFRDAGFDIDMLSVVSPEAVELGLRYVNNDMCYPCLLTTGQLLEAIKEYSASPEQTKPLAVIMSQTGGGCRATNYVSVIRRALDKSGYQHIPIAPFVFGIENSLGLKVRHLKEGLYAILLGDVLMTCLHHARPYEKVPGLANDCLDTLIPLVRADLGHMDKASFTGWVKAITNRFEAVVDWYLPKRPTIGIVGEILLQYHPNGNEHLPEHIESKGCEAVVPPFINFLLYCMTGSVFQHEILGRPWINKQAIKWVISYIENHKAIIQRIFSGSWHFGSIKWHSIYGLAQGVDGVVSLAQSMGEGWLLTAELIELVKSGTTHNVIAQPFACLPNKVIGEGVVREIKARYPESSIISINYDPGASRTNQDNRLQLLVDELRGVIT